MVPESLVAEAMASVAPEEEQSGRAHEEPGEAPRTSLLSLLAQAGVASEEDLRTAAAEGMANGERLGEVALRHGWVDEVTLAKLLARQRGLAFAGGDEVDASADEQRLPAEAARDLGACAVRRADGGVAVAVADPSRERLAQVAERLGREPEFVVVARSVLDALLDGPDGQGAAQDAPAAEQAPDASALADTIAAELDAATATFASLQARIRELVEARRHAEEEAADRARAVAELEAERARDRDAIERLEDELAEQRRRAETARAALGEAMSALQA